MGGILPLRPPCTLHDSTFVRGFRLRGIRSHVKKKLAEVIVAILGEPIVITRSYLLAFGCAISSMQTAIARIRASSWPGSISTP